VSSASQGVHNLVVGSNGWVVFDVQSGDCADADGHEQRYSPSRWRDQSLTALATRPAKDRERAGMSPRLPAMRAVVEAMAANGGSSGGTQPVAGGLNYSSATQPIQAAAAVARLNGALGGAGGGGVRLNVTGMLEVDGRISRRWRLGNPVLTSAVGLVGAFGLRRGRWRVPASSRLMGHGQWPWRGWRRRAHCPPVFDQCLFRGTVRLRRRRLHLGRCRHNLHQGQQPNLRPNWSWTMAAKPGTNTSWAASQTVDLTIKVGRSLRRRAVRSSETCWSLPMDG